MSKKSFKPMAGTVGAAIAGSMMLAGAAVAADNPFGMTELNHGYMQIAENSDGKCGGAKKVEEEAKCGASKLAVPAPKEDMPAEKKADGKCGTAKCGANKR